MNTPKYIVVHCSDSPYGNASLIDEWHKARGWSGIGYHHVILNGFLRGSRLKNDASDGLIENGRKHNHVGAHAEGYNRKSLGICLIGQGDYTPKQLGSLVALLMCLCFRYSIPVQNVIGHCETEFEQRKPKQERKTCPDIDMLGVRTSLDLAIASANKLATGWERYNGNG